MKIQWSLGNCQSNYDFRNYDDDFRYLDKKCYLIAGQHILTCQELDNNYPNLGWKGGSIEIDGHRFCDVFIDSTTMLKIQISGMIAKSKQYSKANFSISIGH